MATSSIVFVALVVFATMVPIAVFAWVAGNKRDKDQSATPDNIDQSVKQGPPQFRQREGWADEATAARNAPRSPKPSSGRPQHEVCHGGTVSSATRHRTPLSSSTTQWDRADTMDTVPQASHAHMNADSKKRQDN
ncbi:hypothetical protein [Mycobacterium sp. DL99]|uniref:hypothetical protein n=1 Tax=Mycobacterium sp. DL99 TaxID=2528957 RepID=UPI001080D05F|nr:hypothetical protein [Mycobacterium sp. DL99]